MQSVKHHSRLSKQQALAKALDTVAEDPIGEYNVWIDFSPGAPTASANKESSIPVVGYSNVDVKFEWKPWTIACMVYCPCESNQEWSWIVSR